MGIYFTGCFGLRSRHIEFFKEMVWSTIHLNGINVTDQYTCPFLG
jgi:hypothetical protein